MGRAAALRVAPEIAEPMADLEAAADRAVVTTAIEPGADAADPAERTTLLAMAALVVRAVKGAVAVAVGASCGMGLASMQGSARRPGRAGRMWWRCIMARSQAGWLGSWV